MKKQIMRRAWELAKEGSKVYGGSAKLYFSESLKIAWKENSMDSKTTLKATSYAGKICEVEFTETGYSITGELDGGYLHISDRSSKSITEACRNQIIKYMFNHKAFSGEPAVGATVQHQYFAGLATKDIEVIGNGGKRGFYA